jgi:hypothetical protein
MPSKLREDGQLRIYEEQTTRKEFNPEAPVRNADCDIFANVKTTDL